MIKRKWKEEESLGRLCRLGKSFDDAIILGTLEAPLQSVKRRPKMWVRQERYIIYLVL